MLNANSSRCKWSMIVLTLATVGALSAPVLGQEAPAVHVGNTQITGLPDDWSHHHVMFSDPGTEQDAVKNGTHEQWLKAVNDPRYVIQQLKRNLAVQGPAAQDVESRSRIAAQDEWWRRQPERPDRRKNKETLKNDWSISMGTGAHGTGGVFPAKYSFSTSAATCSDYAVFPTAVAGSGIVANVVAYTNLYTGTSPLNCNSGTPSAYWAVSVTGGTVTTSPVLSLDGTQAAFMETIGGSAYLVVVLMPTIANASATITSVATGTCSTNTTINTALPGASPVVWCLAINGGAADTHSSPFFDYTHNVLYVGDDSGILHKFSNVFRSWYGPNNSAVPSETAHTIVSSGNALSSPVLDSGTSGLIYVGSAAGAATGGELHSVTTSVGAVVTSGKLATSSTTGVYDAPIVDSSTEKVYAFVGDDVSGGAGSVYQFAVPFTAGTTPTTKIVFNSSLATTIIYAGSFDNAYYTGPGNTGHLYVCTSHSGGTEPELASIPMTGTWPQTATYNLFTNAAATCSPITEVLNGTADYMFVAVSAGGNLTASGANKCTGACVYSFNLTTSTTVPVGGIAATGGASGIIIDNVVSNTGASQAYWVTLGATDAVQAAQGVL